MQSVCMKEARKGSVLQSAEETTLVQLIFGGYLRSKVFFAQSLQLFILIYSVTLDQLCGEANLHYTPTDYSVLFSLICSQIKCSRCHVSSEQCEPMLDLTVEIDGDISSLDEALVRFTSTEVLDGENRYHCSRFCYGSWSFIFFI